MIYYVSKSGNDANTGTPQANAFLTINAGVSKLRPGDTLVISGGTYVETVEISQKNTITIKAAPYQRVNIEQTFCEFRTTSQLPGDTGPIQWLRASDTDPAAHPDEYVSVLQIPFVNPDGVKGAFLDVTGMPYTRLINHSDINDLRSGNEKFGKIYDPPANAPGLVEVTNDAGVTQGFYYPFVYMGPGIWLDRYNTRKLHIRLSHTHHNITGLADYSGEINPNKLRLAISLKSSSSFNIRGSKNVTLQNLCIRFGGEHGINIVNTENVTFDHVQFWCSKYGVTISGNKHLVLKNCLFDGGMPPWYFRSDRKSGYYYKEGDKLIENNLGEQTVSSLLVCSATDDKTEIYNCEFRNGHDLSLGGDMHFHHNHITNLNDDGILFKEPVGNRAKVYKNVFTKCLSCFSFAVKANPDGGPWYIYRNLIDLRLPTASFRPLHPFSTTEDSQFDVWRNGWLHKSGGPSGSVHYFHNTVLVINERSHHASFNHLYAPGSSQHKRSSFNNIFIGINHNPGISKSIMWFPSPVYQDATDGNLYFRIGLNNHKMFQYAKYFYPEGATGPDAERPRKLFDFFDSDYKNCPLYIDSKDHYPPGYENSGIQASPQFMHISNDGLPQPNDDFRLRSHSPAIFAGVSLPSKLASLDAELGLPTLLKPTIGCFIFLDMPLKVGIDGRLSYPDPVHVI